MKLLFLYLALMITQTACQFGTQLIYRMQNTSKSNCEIYVDKILLLACDDGYEAHIFQYFLSNYGQITYSGYLVSNDVILSPHLYAHINGVQKFSFIRGKASNSYIYDQRVIQQLTSDTVQFFTMGDMFITSEFIIYRDTTLKNMIFVDRKTMLQVYMFSQQRNSLIYDVIQRNDSLKSYDMIACTVQDIYDNNTCYMFFVNASVSKANVTLKSSFPMKAFCSDKIKITRNYVVISCPIYNMNRGRLMVFARDSKYNLTLVLNITGEQPFAYLGWDYDIYEQNTDHLILMYAASDVEQLPDNTTFFSTSVRTTHLIRFYYPPEKQYYYISNTTSGVFSIDNSFNRTLTVGYSQQTLLMKYDDSSDLYSSSLCNSSQFLSANGGCLSCPANTVSTSINPPSCQSCSSSNLSPSPFENLMKVKYCSSFINFSLDLLIPPLQKQDNTSNPINPVTQQQNLQTNQSSGIPGWGIFLIVFFSIIVFLAIAIGVACLVYKWIKTTNRKDKERKRKYDEEREDDQDKQDLKDFKPTEQDNQIQVSPVKVPSPRKQRLQDSVVKSRQINISIGESPIIIDSKQNNLRLSIKREALDTLEDGISAEIEDQYLEVSSVVNEKDDMQIRTRGHQKPIAATAVKQQENSLFPSEQSRILQLEGQMTPFKSLGEMDKVASMIETDEKTHLRQLSNQYSINDAKNTSPRNKDNSNSCAICVQTLKLTDTCEQLKNCNSNHQAHSSCIAVKKLYGMDDPTGCDFCKGMKKAKRHFSLASKARIDQIKRMKLDFGAIQDEEDDND